MDKLIKINSPLLETLTAEKNASIIRRAVRGLKVKDTINLTVIRDHKPESKQLIHTWLIAEIVRLFKWLNFQESKTPSGDIIEEWAFSMMETYQTETLEDFAIFFKKVRKGSISLNHYERIGVDTLNNAFNQYLEEYKAPARENQRKNEGKELNNLSGYQTDGYKKILKELGKGLNDKRKEKAERAKKQSGYSMTYEQEIKELEGLVGKMTMKDLNLALAQYENQSVLAHVHGEETKPVQIINAEIKRRENG